MNTRNDYRKKMRRRKRFFRIFLVLFLLVITIGTAFTLYQYQAGKMQAGESKAVNDNVAAFNGEKDEQGKVNVLLLGVDSRGEEQSRTDTIMIAQYDPENEKARLVSLMRDIYVDIPDHGKWKLNTSYFLGGPELLRQTLKENFDIDVQYYALVDFKGFQNVVDVLAPNGIEMNVEKPMSEKINVSLEPGLQTLDGEELLGYARFRHDAEGDFGRVERQQKVINALKDELLSLNGVSKLPKLMGTISPYIETNIGGMDRIGLVKEFILNPVNNIETFRLPVDNSYTNERYEKAGAVLEIDFEENKKALKAFLNGEDPSLASETTKNENEDEEALSDSQP
ncbi:LCP family protein [Rossellomorea aquimaris]|uniref:LCP family protein n=1 Tax=Rossellomorea aquimaris TaxID=189382 RepID=UPI001CD65E46|nr:LCP family protein [Rossellomorea aquimaris]MCA1060807.1 LCP family protein [Rossellomorea aquimaris]